VIFRVPFKEKVRLNCKIFCTSSKYFVPGTWINSASIFKQFTLFGIVVFLSSCRVIEPAAPSMPAKIIPDPKQPTSVIDIPVSIDLNRYFREAEASVDTLFTGKEAPCEGLRYSYLFRRYPFNITGNGNQIDLSFEGQYQIDLVYCAKCMFDRCIVPLVGGSCGLNEPRRKMNIAYSSTIALLPDYRLKSTTALTKLEPVNRCNLTVFNFDATDKLIGYVKPELTDLGKMVDKQMDSLNLKAEVKSFWNEISGEIPLGSYGFLSLNPKSLGVGSLNMKGSMLDFNLALSVKPVLRTKSKPMAPVALPNLSAYTPGTGFNVLLDLYISYDSLSKYVGQEVNGVVIKMKNKKVIIKNVDIQGLGNEKIVIKVDFAGTRKGIMYMVGTPSYQSITGDFTIPDLAFDIKTKSVLFKMARWLFNDKLTNAVKEGIRYNFNPMLEQSRIDLQKELNHDFGGGVKSTGQVTDLVLQEIYPAQNNVILRVLSKGTYKVKMQ
jgi:hypothetical protein